MKSTVVPSPFITICLIGMSITFVCGFVLARIYGNKEIEALKTQYAQEDAESAKTVEKLVKDLKDQCQEEKDYILNNMHGGS